MASELIAGLSIFKSLYDSAKALKDINDSTVRNTAVIELQEKILAAREAQSTLLDRVSELEEQVAGFEKWDAEKERYELKQMVLAAPTFAYTLKPEAQPPETFHCICASCYQNRVKSILQFSQTVAWTEEKILACPVCKTEVHIIKWPP